MASLIDADPAAGDLAPDDGPRDADGSNAFALAGRKTTSGAPILLANPHLQWRQLYWEAHVTVPGRVDFYGSTLVGFPWLRAGFNDRLGYVQTNNDPDTDDIFALPLDPARPDYYRFEGKSRPLDRIEVVVEVKQADGRLKTERRTYWRSRLGPIVYRNKTTAFAYRSTALDAWRFFEGFWRLTHARSLKDYLKTLSMRLSPTSNYTYADADGNILYLWNARIPKRRQDGASYDLDVPGDTAKYVWTSLHPTRDLPQLLNPAGGYIQNANNPPWFVSRSQRLDPARYPSYFERGELALRPQLALEMLESRATFSVDEVKRLKFETRLLLAERVKPAIIAALAAEAALARRSSRGAPGARGVGRARVGGKPRRGALPALLGDVSRGDRAALRRDVGRGAALRDAARNRRSGGGAETPGRRRAMDAGDLRRRGRGLGRRVPLSVRRSRSSRRRRHGRARRISRADVRRRAAGVAGKPGAARIAGWADPDRQLAGFGDAWVLLVHFTRPVQAFSVLAYGETTDRTSPHSRDQIRIFAGRDLRPAWFRGRHRRAPRARVPARPAVSASERMWGQGRIVGSGFAESPAMIPEFMLHTDSVSWALRGQGRVSARRSNTAPPKSASVPSRWQNCDSAPRPRDHGSSRADRHPRRSVDVLPFDQGAADHVGTVALALARRGEPIGTFDTLIAAHVPPGRNLVASRRGSSPARAARARNWSRAPFTSTLQDEP